MGIKSDRWIIDSAAHGRLIEPFESSQVRQGIISFGVSSYGYDLRLADEFKLFRGSSETVLDPKHSDPSLFEDLRASALILPPHTFCLGRSLEYLRIPRDILGLCLGKSTYARAGILVNVTPLEAEWEGHLTISISNTSPAPVKLYAHEGIAQIIFLEASEVCATSYRDRKGKYQAQKTITLPRI